MGKVKWAVLTDGTLVVVPKFVGNEEIPHTALTRGADVLAAGEAVIIGNAVTATGGWRSMNTAVITGRLLVPRNAASTPSGSLVCCSGDC